MQRGKKTALNTLMSVLEEAVSIICGLILPRLILKAFGSQYNGLTASITQFLSMAVLLRGGIGGATRAALYTPLAKRDKNAINAIIRATDLFMKKIGIILACAIVIFASIYGLITINEFDWFFTFSLFLIIGLSTFVENFAGVTYQILLQADQRLWVAIIIKTTGTILSTVLSAILIYCGAGIHLVKLGSAIVFVAKPIVMQIYVRRHYKLDLSVEPNNQAISQRWDAFWHQLASFVMNNTDIVVLTLFSNLREVSVYTIYHMIYHNINLIANSFTNGIEAAFGNMIAKGEKKILSETFSLMEWLIISISTMLCSVALLLIFDFIKLYTKGIYDVEYIRPTFAYVVLFTEILICARTPSQLVSWAAGKYKETRNGAIIEPIINIVISVLLVIRYGLIGVAIGTLVATLFRTIQYGRFASKYVIRRSQWILPIRVIVSLIETGIIFIIWKGINFQEAHNYFEWGLHGIIGCFIASFVIFIFSFILYRKDLMNTVKRIKNLHKNGSVGSKNHLTNDSR